MNNRNSDSMHRMLRAYAHQLTGNTPHLADKLLAETLSHLATRATAYPPTLIGFNTWAKIVMKNTFHRTIENADFHELHHLAHRGTLNPMLPVSNKEYTLLEQIQMMSRLTPHQAATVTLRLHGYAHTTIAQAMNTTTAQVRNHLRQARHTLIHAWDN